MGVTKTAKIQISICLGSIGKSAFFQIADPSSAWGPQDGLGFKNAKGMTLTDFEGGLFYTPECLT